MSEPALDPARCPICARPNECAAAAGREMCWCFEATLAPEVLARIPERALGLACICAKCGRGEAPGARD
jgi:Cysteine-rich CWC